MRRRSESSTLSIIATYGRDARARSCARRSLAAATIFMALVIWRVFLILRMRRLKSRTFAILPARAYFLAPAGCACSDGVFAAPLSVLPPLVFPFGDF